MTAAQVVIPALPTLAAGGLIYAATAYLENINRTYRDSE